VLRTDPVNKAGDLVKRMASLEDLDDEAVDFIATEVLRLTKPGLFHATEDDAEAAQKND